MPLKSRNLIDDHDPRVSQFGHPAPPWMVNYADLMTELVIFYLILYSFSGALSGSVQEARAEIQDVITESDIAGKVEITQEGLSITLQEQGSRVFFLSGSAEITSEMKHILDKLAPAFKGLAEKNHDMIVQGHTDDIPIETKAYPSNWELSTARATHVVRYLLAAHEFPPERIAAVGYGEYKNLARSSDEDLVAWRAKNRRVVFLVKNLTVETKKEETPSESEGDSTPSPSLEIIPK